ncbi:hypothetical protein ABZU09_06900 [Lactobacillus mulieris]|jgi:hypothetical protein|nr:MULTISPECIES: hypothetical protein [Lactobacillus]EFH29575.1 hypothetical protein HMPREF0526_11178 [Lactobacillus jensenii JV-V16]EQM96003.1 hypothetical protein HMPREF0525_01497 [Lactobacillus jensenii 27-2-CHN]MCT7673863.1 hypothetical protein [Lactobacillus mulieris]MCT7771925.1 hypothetical protein [Lactobacillus mulieris]MCW8073664.1 hypothetical protein [Lactobacillus mulieris]
MSKLKKKNFNPSKSKIHVKQALKNYAGKKGKAIHRLNIPNKSA